MNKINCLADLIEMNLSTKGCRITKSRKEFIEFVINYQNDFFTINDYILEKGKINIATFYNHITLLIDANIIGKIKNADETKYFLKAKTNVIIRCNNCGQERLEKNMKVPTFEITNICQYDCLIFRTKCEKCEK